METRTTSSGISRDSQPTTLPRTAMLIGLALGLIGSATRVSAQAPTLMWSTNIGARLFAVDDQTNSYANVGGSVIVINPNGVPVSTNVICPKPGVARRDASGNFYFAGNFDGTQNFGGITLVGGWTNSPAPGGWTPGYPQLTSSRNTPVRAFFNGQSLSASRCSRKTSFRIFSWTLAAVSIWGISVTDLTVVRP